MATDWPCNIIIFSYALIDLFVSLCQRLDDSLDYFCTNGLFMCQDDENEPEDERFRSFWIKPLTNGPVLPYIVGLHVKRKGRRIIATFLLLNFARRCCSARVTEPRPQKQDLTLLSKTKWNSHKPFSSFLSAIRNGIRPSPLQKVMHRSLRKQRDIGT